MELSRNDKVIIYVIGMLMELKEKGLVTSGAYVLSGKGKLNYEALKKNKFQPTDEEIRAAMKAIQSA